MRKGKVLATLSAAYEAAVLDVLEVLDVLDAPDVLDVVVEVEVAELLDESLVELLLDELPGLRASVL
jgi:hypothetical protein